eukprot:Pgem_evm1s15377
MYDPIDNIPINATQYTVYVFETKIIYKNNTGHTTNTNTISNFTGFKGPYPNTFTKRYTLPLCGALTVTLFFNCLAMLRHTIALRKELNKNRKKQEQEQEERNHNEILKGDIFGWLVKKDTEEKLAKGSKNNSSNNNNNNNGMVILSDEEYRSLQSLRYIQQQQQHTESESMFIKESFNLNLLRNIPTLNNYDQPPLLLCEATSELAMDSNCMTKLKTPSGCLVSTVKSKYEAQNSDYFPGVEEANYYFPGVKEADTFSDKYSVQTEYSPIFLD